MKRFFIEYADWSRREYAAIASNLLLGRMHRGPNERRLALRLARMYAPSDVQLLNYGHHAIEIALSIFKEKSPGRLQVVGPAYICPSVPESVRRCGLQWRSVDIREDLNIDVNALASVLDAETLAVVVPHMYGCPADIVEIEDLCNKAGIYLIDDAAQIVGRKVNGRLLGTFGDMGVVSFAQSKTVVTGVRGSGGMLLVNKAEWQPDVRRHCAKLAPSAGRLVPILDFAWNYLGGRLTGNSGYYLSRIFRAMGIDALRIPAAMKIANLEAAIALVQLDRLESIIENKLRIARHYHEVLNDFPGLRFPQYASDRLLTRVVLEIPVDVDLAAFRYEVGRQGVQTRMPYPLAPDAGDGLLAFSLSRRLLGVPCGSDLLVSDIENICAILNRALRYEQIR